MSNLLVNSNFQAPYSFPSQGNEDVQRITATGTAMIRVPNIRVPTGWTCFTYDDGTFRQIEMGLGDTSDRLYNGHSSIKWFKYGVKHKAGLYQELQLQPGRYVFRAWAHGWSNHPGACVGHESCKNQPGCSVGAGFEPYYAEVVPGEQPTGDAWKDGLLNMTFSLAVAVRNGPDIEGKRAHIYNAYHEIPALEFDLLESTTVVCGIACETRWGFENANAYIGEASLERVGDEPGAPPTESGLPRIQYTRVVNVVPESAGIERAVEVLRRTWPATVTNSYDDAGIGALDNKTARLWDIPSSETSDYLNFFQEFYPGTRVEFVGGEPVPPSVLKLAYPTTHQPAVITSRFGDTVGRTIPHCGLDLRSSWRVWGDEVLCAFPGMVVISGDVGGGFGIQVRTETALADGRVVLVRYGHLVPSKERVDAGEMVNAGDLIGYPNSGGVSTGDHLHIDVMVDGKYVDPEPLIQWPDDPVTPPPPPPPAQPRNYLGLHLQTMVGGWDGYVRDTGTTTKVLASMQDVIGVNRVRPDVPVFWRHVTNNYGDTLENPDPLAGARKWVAKFSDSLRIECDRLAALNLTPPYFYVESVNEVYPPTPRAVAFDRAFIVALAELGLPVAPCVMTAAVGNPHESEFPLLVPLARECAAAGGAFGYHAYWMANQTDTDALTKYWQWLAGRWTEMDKVLVAAGVRVKWAFTECGAVGGQFVPAATASAMALSAQEAIQYEAGGEIVKPTWRFVGIPHKPSLLEKIAAFVAPNTFTAQAAQDGGFNLLPGDGWLSEKCYNGDWARYLADMRKFNELCAASVAGREGRVIGGHVFTSGQGVGWEKFQIRDPQMQGMRTL